MGHLYTTGMTRFKFYSLAEVTSDFVESEKKARQARALAMDSENYELAVNSSVDLGQAVWRQGNLPLAEKTLNEALSLAQTHQFLAGEALVLLNLGIVYFFENNSEKAQHYYELALDKQHILGDLKVQVISIHFPTRAITHQTQLWPRWDSERIIAPQPLFFHA
jgi:tetratricopeptide (TPR) repeat protein